MNLCMKKVGVDNLVVITDSYNKETVCVVNKKYAPMIVGALTFSYKRYFSCLTSSDGNSEAHEAMVENYLGVPREKMQF